MATKKLTTLDQLKKLAEKAKSEVDTLSGKMTALEGKGYQTKEQVEAAIKAQVSSVYKAGGSVDTIEDLTGKVIATNIGMVYNVQTDFTVSAIETEDVAFVDTVAAEARYPGGTNVVVVEVGEDVKEYKLDVLSGFVDLSSYAEKHEITDALTDYVKTATADSTYLKTATAESDYLKKTEASSTYLTTEAAASTYATKTTATGEADGLMSSTDKTKLDELTVAEDTEVESMLTEVFSPVSP